jgi:4-hydroxyphenylpyruvate dioxygenase
MGPFPHDAPKAVISAENPAGTDGFEFVEFGHAEPEKLDALFRSMGFVPVARHRTKAITLYRQGGINYLLNAEPGSHAAGFIAAHGPCAPAMAWRVVDARHALKRAVDFGATEYTGPGKSLDVPAVIGIGGSLLYFVETHGDRGSCYDAAFEWLGERDPRPLGVGFYTSTT